MSRKKKQSYEELDIVMSEFYVNVDIELNLTYYS